MKRVSHLLLLLFSASCNQSLYQPSRVNTPCFSQKEEAQLSGVVQLQGASPAVAVHADGAFAPVEHFGVIGSYRSINKKDYSQYLNNLSSAQFDITNLDGRSFEAGAGYFAHGTGWRFELFGGGGNGVLNSKHGGYNINDYSARFNKFFGQIGGGISSRNLTLILGCKLSYEKYYRFTSINAGMATYLLPEHVDLTKPGFSFYEPYLELRDGFGWVKGFLQVGGAFRLNAPELYQYFPWQASAGLMFDYVTKAGRKK